MNLSKLHNAPNSCAGKGCSYNASYLLKIRYINKSGWFCESCKAVLENNGLISSFHEETKQ